MSEYIPYSQEERRVFIHESIRYAEQKLAERNAIHVFIDAVARSLAPAAVYTKFLDVSHWQNGSQPNNVIDWQVLWDAGYRGVAIKCTEGYSSTDQWVDPYFEQNAMGAVDAGFQVIYYHLFRQNLDATRQADALMRHSESMIEYADGNVRLAGDFETTDGQTQSVIRTRTEAFLNFLDANHRTPVAYSAAWWWNTNIGDVDWINRFWLWAANWTGASTPYLPVGWDMEKLKIWQWCVCPKYSWCQPCDFVLPGSWDLNRYYGTEQELVEWLVYDNGTTPPPTHDHPEIWAAIAQLQEEVSLLSSSVTAMQTTIDELSGKTDVIESEVEEIGASVEELETHTHNASIGEPV